MIIASDYDGKTGLYACLTPTVLPPKPTITTINRLPIVWHGLEQEEYHVTVVYDDSATVSREDLESWIFVSSSIPNIEDPSAWKASDAASRPRPALRAATVSKVLWWTAKDSVYVGLELYCPEAFALHEEMKATLGVKSSFPSYKCHLTYGRWKNFPPSLVADIVFMNDFVSRAVSAEVPPILELSSLEIKNAKY